MKTVVVCTESSCARVFQTTSDGVRLCCNFTPLVDERRSFPRVLADKIESIFNIDDGRRLLLAGEPSLVNQICVCLSDSARERIIGISPQMVKGMRIDSVFRFVSQEVKKWECRHGFVLN